ncbi:MAG TPA: hypothetical protein VLL82_15570, partial [Mycobacterium sp.]|nr:hypothetical protein [Mycobacterium sp.]
VSGLRKIHRIDMYDTCDSLGYLLKTFSVFSACTPHRIRHPSENDTGVYILDFLYTKSKSGKRTRPLAIKENIGLSK